MREAFALGVRFSRLGWRGEVGLFRHRVYPLRHVTARTRACSAEQPQHMPAAEPRSTMSNDASRASAPSKAQDDDEPDDWCVQLSPPRVQRRKDQARSGLTNGTARDKRIFSTGCAGTLTSCTAPSTSLPSVLIVYCAYLLTCGLEDENMKLTDCYYDKKDWRACKKEVSPPLLLTRYDGRAPAY